MTIYEPLDANKHKSIKIHPDAGVEFARTQHLISLRVTEIDKAISDFPVMFFRNHQTGKLSIAMMTSFKPGDNLFVEGNVWDALFMPGSLKTHPFHVISNNDSDESYSLTINVESPCLVAEGGNALFSDNGQPTPYLAQVKANMDEELNNELLTREFLETIDALGLTAPIDLEIELADGQSHTISGLQTVAEDKLRLIGQDVLLELHSKGYLFPLHAMLMSLFQINGLIRRNNKVLSHPAIKNVHLRLQGNSQN